MREVWMPVLGYDGFYEASNTGKIRRDMSSPVKGLSAPGKELKCHIQKTGYSTVSLSKHGDVKSFTVHYLILSAFCGDRPFVGAQVAHNDGIRSNNNLTNLRWVYPAENKSDSMRHLTIPKGEDHRNSVLNEKSIIEIRRRAKLGETSPQIAADYNVSASTIHQIRHYRTWKHIS